MAKEITRWKCTKCNTEYVEQATALRCENAHQKPIATRAVNPKEYHSIFVSNTEIETVNYPDVIEVTFEDGMVKTYDIRTTN